MGSKTSNDKIFLLSMLLLAALIRLHLLFASGFVIDADEAIVGLMGKHILEGRPIPVFYYGQHYMGSLEAILAAGSFALFGISSCALKLVPFLVSLALVPLIYYFVREISERATAQIATVLFAVPPAALVEWSTKARGGFIEVVFLGTLAFFFAVRFLKNEKFNVRLILSFSFLLGVGWWVNNQIVYFMLPIGLTVLGRLLWNKKDPLKMRLVGIFTGIGAFFVGGLPYWVYNLQNDFISFQMFTGASRKEIWSHIAGLFTHALPILTGAKRFWHDEPLFAGSVVLAALLYGTSLLIFMSARRRDLLRAALLRFDGRHPWEMLLIFVIGGLYIFASSSFGYLVQAPRYLLPLYVGILPLLAFAMTRVPRLIGGVLFSGVFTLNILSSYYGGLAIPGEPYVFNGERVSRDHTEILAWLNAQGISHVRTNYWIGYRLAFESKEKVKFDLFQVPYHERIPEYESVHIDEGILAEPIIAVPSQAELIRAALHALHFDAKEVVRSGYTVFYDINLPHHESFKQIPPHLFDITSTVNAKDIHAAIDGDLKTRWGSAQPQSPGMEIHVQFREPTSLRFLTLDCGSYQTDFARRLEFFVSDGSGVRRPLYNPSDLFAVRYFGDWADNFELLVPPGKYSDLWIVQAGSDPVYDWSIAELKLFTD